MNSRALSTSSGNSLPELFGVRPYDVTRAVAFMHIPKTSGIAIRDGLVGVLAPRHVFLGVDRSLFGAFQRFDTMSDGVRNTIHLDEVRMPAEADFISGHFSFSALSSAYRDAQFITFLREPFSRILSHWLFLRSFSDEKLHVWGEWGKFVHEARGSIARFLSCSSLACQLDNIVVRMLLWPHPLIPDGEFIDPRDDEILFGAALSRLAQLAYCDIIENPAFQRDIGSWLGRTFTYGKVNETVCIPAERSTQLHEEFTTESMVLVDSLTRLDVRLWMALATERVSGVAAEALRRHTLVRNTARQARLMA
jgi:hypothetical protein